MMISHEKKFILFSGWKTASQTCKLRLEKYNGSTYPDFFYFNKFLNRVVHQHITCADFECLPESKLGYFKAAFVRNPYDRVYSGFLQLQKDIQAHPLSLFSDEWVKNIVMKQLEENYTQLSSAGFDFNEWVGLLKEDQIYEIGRNTNFPLHPNHYWTHINGIPYVDFIGTVEQFESDFLRFLDKVGISERLEASANVVDLDGESDTNPFNYRYVHLMDKQSINKINHLFASDFELFGYIQID